MTPTLLLINGPMGSGKSTLTKELDQRLADYTFIDRAYIKDVMLRRLKKENRPLAKQLSQEATLHLARGLMPLQKNILIQEVSPYTLQLHLGSLMQAHNYRLRSFFLTCSLDTSQRRVWERGGQYTAERVKEIYLTSHALEGDILVDTELLLPEQSLQRIMCELEAP